MSARKKAAPKPAAKAPKPAAKTLESAASNPLYKLRLYIAGKTARSEAALHNLQAICDTHLKGMYRIEVVDLLQNPQLARGDQIFAVPTLVRQLPPPVKKIIGDLSNVERVLVGLDLRAVPNKAAP